MAEQRTPIDITNMPDLVGIVEEVQRTKRPRVLRREEQDVAVVVPLPSDMDTAGNPSAAAVAAALAAGGSWEGLVDAAALKAQLHAARGSHRTSPPL